MRYIRYSKYIGEAADDIDLQELMSRLADFLLQSGFESQYGICEMDTKHSREQTMEQLREAIRQALEMGDLLPRRLMKKMGRIPTSRRTSSSAN